MYMCNIYSVYSVYLTGRDVYTHTPSVEDTPYKRSVSLTVRGVYNRARRCSGAFIYHDMAYLTGRDVYILYTETCIYTVYIALDSVVSHGEVSVSTYMRLARRARKCSIPVLHPARFQILSQPATFQKRWSNRQMNVRRPLCIYYA